MKPFGLDPACAAKSSLKYNGMGQTSPALLGCLRRVRAGNGGRYPAPSFGTSIAALLWALATPLAGNRY